MNKFLIILLIIPLQSNAYNQVDVNDANRIIKAAQLLEPLVRKYDLDFVKGQISTIVVEVYNSDLSNMTKLMNYIESNDYTLEEFSKLNELKF